MDAADGAGLAAPQAGVLRRVVVVDAGEGRVELVNPRITLSEGTQGGYEGCLSFPVRRSWPPWTSLQPAPSVRPMPPTQAACLT